MRPGALLWSIFAGPLVNIILLPVTIGAWWYAAGQLPQGSDLLNFLEMIVHINLVLLIFNMIPVYPLDGGQILHALLWFVAGYARSLRIVSVIGLIGAAGMGVLFYLLDFGAFSFVLLAFIGLQAWNGYRMASYLSQNPQVAMRLERASSGREEILLEEDPRLRQQHDHPPVPPPIPNDRR